MGFPTKVQLIRRKASEQYYINFPSALAQAIELGKGEVVEWIVVDKANLILARSQVPPNPVEVQKKATSLLSERLSFLLDAASSAATSASSCASRLCQHLLGLLL